MAPLHILLSRQANLQSLEMEGDRAFLGVYEFSKAQKDKILKVVTETAPSCDLLGELKSSICNFF